MIKNQTKPSLLSKAMTENAIFSGLAGLVLVVGASGLDGWLGVDARLLAAIGLGLVVYAADLMWWSRSPRWLVTGGRMAVVADLGWVVAAAALIAFTAVLTTQGEAALALVSVVIAALAAVQWMGLRKLAAGA
jgi:hypothetical protein